MKIQGDLRVRADATVVVHRELSFQRYLDPAAMLRCGVLMCCVHDDVPSIKHGDVRVAHLIEARVELLRPTGEPLDSRRVRARVRLRVRVRVRVRVKLSQSIPPPQPSTLAKSFPVPRGRTATGKARPRCKSLMALRTQPTVPSPPQTSTLALGTYGRGVG